MASTRSVGFSGVDVDSGGVRSASGMGDPVRVAGLSPRLFEV
jgi:hypothetical protein